MNLVNHFDRALVIGLGTVILAGAISVSILVWAVSTVDAGSEPSVVSLKIEPHTVVLSTGNIEQKISVLAVMSDGSVSSASSALGDISINIADSSIAYVSADQVVRAARDGATSATVTAGGLITKARIVVFMDTGGVPALDPRNIVQFPEISGASVVNRLIVTTRPGEDISAVAKSVGAVVIDQITGSDISLLELESSDSISQIATMDVLSADHRVTHVSPEILMPAAGHELDFMQLSGDLRKPFEILGLEDAIRELEKHPLSMNPVGIAILDMGLDLEMFVEEFDLEHVQVIDLVPDELDDNLHNYHGTYVTGVVAAENNGRLSSGVLASVGDIPFEIYFYKIGVQAVLDNQLVMTVSTYAELKALADIYRRRSAIDLVNMSYGSDCKNTDDDNSFVAGLCSFGGLIRNTPAESFIALMPDIMFVTAAGNSGIDSAFAIPSNIASTHDNFVAVGSTTGDERTRTSNYGLDVTLSAPGTNIATTSVFNPGVAKGVDGTSISAPIVTATMALLRSFDPEITPKELESHLVSTADKINVCEKQKCLNSEHVEWSRVRIDKAIEKIIGDNVAGSASLSKVESNVGIGDFVEFGGHIENEGQFDWAFGISAQVRSPNGKIVDLPFRSSYVPAGSSSEVAWGFWPNQAGDWDVKILMYTDIIAFDRLIFESDWQQGVIKIDGQVSEPPLQSQDPDTFTLVDPIQLDNVVAPPDPGGLLNADANVLILADTSGSMDGGKISRLRDSLTLFMSMIEDPGEKIGLIDFDDAISEVIPIGTDRQLWSREISKLDDEGGTALFDAIAHGYDILQREGADDRLNLLIVLSDGADSDSIMSSSQVRNYVQSGKIPVLIYAIGYGDGANLAILDSIAGATGGLAFPGEPQDIDRLFRLLTSLF
ncbi:MAG: S8 family serine peptidase [Chloroflexi bacterium]|jgi:uncharacterized protein YegL|nr:S8 family serine peptidase [Chloroflexota bacterium]MBT5628637.1 S8 family serine peptidase [Chloroflexota bacterium]